MSRVSAELPGNAPNIGGNRHHRTSGRREFLQLLGTAGVAALVGGGAWKLLGNEGRGGEVVTSSDNPTSNSSAINQETGIDNPTDSTEPNPYKKEIIINQNLYSTADRQRLDPAIARNVAENGTFEELTELFQVTLDRAPSWEPSWSDFKERRGYDDSVREYIIKLTKGLLTGCTADEIMPFLKRGDKYGFIREMAAKYNLAVVKGLNGFEGPRVGFSDITNAERDLRYTDDWILSSSHYELFAGPHEAVLGSYFTTADEYGTLDQTFELRLIESELNNDASNNFYSVTADLELTHSVGAGNSGQPAFSEDVTGFAYIGFYPREEYGINTVALGSDSNLQTIFANIEAELR